MENNINIQLHNAFRDITYSDSSHSYYKDGNKLQSVTQFLGSLKSKFDREYFSIYKAYEFSGLSPKYNWKDHQNRQIMLEDGTLIYLSDEHNIRVTPEMVLDQWQIDSDTGMARGTYIHNYLECKEQRLLDIPQLPYLNSLDTIQAIRFYNSIQVGIGLANQFLDYAKTNLVPIAMEYVVGSDSLSLAGRFDRLYWNIQDKEYQIWDFKTDKKIEFSGRDKLAIFKLPNCEFEKYSLQCSIYKYCIEEGIGESIGQSKIVHFDLRSNEWKILPCTDYTQLIKEKSGEIFSRIQK